MKIENVRTWKGCKGWVYPFLHTHILDFRRPLKKHENVAHKPAKAMVSDVSKFGIWGRSFSRRSACLLGSKPRFWQASSKTDNNGVCFETLTEIRCPSGHKTIACMDIFRNFSDVIEWQDWKWFVLILKIRRENWG